MSSETEYVMTLFIFSLKWFIPEACALHLINQHMSLHFTLKSLHHNYVVFSDSSFLIIFTRWSISCFFKRANTLKPVFQTYIFLHTQKMCVVVSSERCHLITMGAEQKCTKLYQINKMMQIHESLQRQEITSYMFHYYRLLVMIKKVPTYVCLCFFPLW